MSNPDSDFDALVLGAGRAGLAAALGLLRAAIDRVLVADPRRDD